MSETQENAAPPSEHAIRRARDQGKIAYSSHLAVAVTSIGILGLLTIFGKSLLRDAITDLGNSLSSVTTSVESFDMHDIWDRPILKSVSLLIGAIFLLVVLSRSIQVGAMLRPSRALPNMSNIDFATGVQRIFAMSNVIRCVQILFVTSAFVVVLIVFFYQRYPSIIALGIAQVERLPRLMSAEFFKLFSVASMLALTVGLIDYYWQRRRFISELTNDEGTSRRPIQAIFNERQPDRRP